MLFYQCTARFIILVVSTVFMGACSTLAPEEKDEPNTPAALQEESSFLEVSSKRMGNNLVENLYEEYAVKIPTLKKLETTLDSLKDMKKNAIEQFSSYHEKSLAYYTSATSHLEQISDTLLRERMKLLINNSQVKYNTLTAAHTDLIKTIDAKTTTLHDLHTILKIVKTIPIIEKYQQENKPSTKPLQDYKKEVERVVVLTDSIIQQ